MTRQVKDGAGDPNVTVLLSAVTVSAALAIVHSTVMSPSPPVDHSVFVLSVSATVAEYLPAFTAESSPVIVYPLPSGRSGPCSDAL